MSWYVGPSDGAMFGRLFGYRFTFVSLVVGVLLGSYYVSVGQTSVLMFWFNVLFSLGLWLWDSRGFWLVQWHAYRMASVALGESLMSKAEIGGRRKGFYGRVVGKDGKPLPGFEVDAEGRVSESIVDQIRSGKEVFFVDPVEVSKAGVESVVK